MYLSAEMKGSIVREVGGNRSMDDDQNLVPGRGKKA